MKFEMHKHPDEPVDGRKAAIEKGLAEKLGDEVMDLSVAVDIHANICESDERRFTRIVARVWTTEITIIKPASRLDMIKAAMPSFIRRMFPPKTVKEYHVVGLPGLKDIKKSKVGALIYTTQELEENPDLFIKWCVESAADELRHTYTNRTFRGW